MLLCTGIYNDLFSYAFSSFGYIYPKVELLDYMIFVCLLFAWLYVKSIFFIEAALFYIPTYRAWGSNVSTSCTHLLFSLSFLIIVILMDAKWFLIVVLVCISLMTSDVEHVFVYLLTICIPFPEVYLSPFKIGLFVLLVVLVSRY